MAGPVDAMAYKDMLVILGTTAVMVPLFRRLGVSPILGFIGAGALLGPYGLARLTEVAPWLAMVTIPDAQPLAPLAELGIVFLFFLIGLELSFERLTRMKKLVFGLGLAQFGLCAVALAGLALAFGQPLPAALVIGGALALSCTSITVEHLAQEKRLASATGRTTFSVLLFQDLAVIPMIVAVGAVAAVGLGGSVGWTIGVAMLKAVVVIVGVIVVGRWLLRPFFRYVAVSGKQEVFMAAALVVILGTGVLAAAFGASMALGAFLAGLLLAETEYRRAIEAVIEPFKSILLGLFFFSVGMSIDLAAVAAQPMAVVGLIVGLITLKALLVWPLVRAFGQSWRVGFRSAVLLGPSSEFAFVLFGLAATANIIAPGPAAVLVAGAAISMALIPLLDRAAGALSRRFETPAPVDPTILEVPPPQSKRVIVVGYGRVGQMVCEMLRRHRIPFIAVDTDAREVAFRRRMGDPVYYGDAASRAFLERCDVVGAAALVITIHTAGAVEEIARLGKQLNAELTIIARARDADHARALYAIGVLDAVPETIEASLQLSEAVLMDLGVAAGRVIASIHEKRDEVRAKLRDTSMAGEAVARVVPVRRGPAPE